MSLTLSDWFYEGILMDGGLLAIDPAYFSITGGRERWLYRVARKHAGGAGEEGFAIPLPTMFEKSGAEGTYRRFKFEIQTITRRNDIPGFDLALELTQSYQRLAVPGRAQVLRAEAALEWARQLQEQARQARDKNERQKIETSVRDLFAKAAAVT